MRWERDLLFCFCFTVLLFVNSGFASQFHVRPVRQEIELEHGSKATMEYTVYNTSARELLLDITVVEWRKFPWNRKINFKEWFDLDFSKQLRLVANSSSCVLFNIEVPGEASGELVAMIYFANNSPESQYKLKFGVSLYIIVKGTIRRKCKICKVLIDNSTVDSKTRAPLLAVSVEIENKGNVHLRPKLEVVVQSEKGAIQVPFKFGCPVFPDDSTFYSGKTILEQRLAPGRYPMILNIREGGLKRPITQKGLLIITQESAEFYRPDVQDER